MKERQLKVTMQGKPLTLLGNEVKEGDKVPDCVVADENLNPISLSSFKGKVCLILTVPSLDTSVCSMEARKFNQEMEKFGPQVTTIVISMDLPFAQKRWCAAEGIKNLRVFSDYQKGDAGEKFGILIKDLHLLARAAFIVDAQGVIRFVHFVKEVTQEPDYKLILNQIQNFAPANR